MRKTALGSLLKKIILFVLLVTVVLVGSIFLLDKYPSKKINGGENVYADEYWQNLDGFKHYSEWEEPTHKYNYLKAEYVSPFKNNMTVDELLAAARYDEELVTVTAQYRVDKTTTSNEIEDVLKSYYKGNIYEYVLNVFGKSYSAANPGDAAAAHGKLVALGYTGTEADLVALGQDLANLSKTFETLVQNGIKAENCYELISILFNDSFLEEGSLYAISQEAGYTGDINQWVLEILGVVKNNPADMYATLVGLGYADTEDELVKIIKDINNLNNNYFDYVSPFITEIEFANLLLNDTGNANRKSAYEIVSSYDEVLLQELQAKLVELTATVEKVDQRLLALPGWIEYLRDTLYGGYLKVLENNRFELYFQVYNTFFKLVDKETGNEWYSNPEDPSAAQSVILSINYSKLGGVAGTFNNYKDSVADHDIDNTSDALVPNFYTKFDKIGNKVQVYYVMEDRNINMNAFPRYISATRFEELLERNKQIAASGAVDSKGAKIVDIKKDKDILGKLTLSYFGIVNADDELNKKGYEYYELAGYNTGLGYTAKKELYRWMYEWMGYTAEDLAKDNAEFDVQVKDTKYVISAGIEYSLTDEGLKIMVPGNSIIDTEDAPATTVDVLPFFTAVDNETEGYTIIPDGSGALLNHNNGKYEGYPSYTQRVYSTDLTTVSEVKQTEANDVMFPMFAVVNTEPASGILYECEQGGGQLKLNADVSGRGGSKYNTQSFTIFLREMKYIYIGPSYARKEMAKWTTSKVTDDFIFNAIVLDEEELNYSAVAKKYREILIDRYDLEENDTTDKAVLDLDVIGAYEFDNNFAGIPYTDYDSLTTFAQLQEMLDAYKDLGVKDINVFYLGWRDSGLLNKTFKNIRISNLLGSKKDFLKLVENNKRNVTIYPYLSFGLVNKYQESFGQAHYTTRSVDGKYVISYPYDLNSNLYNKKGNKMMAVSPHYYQVLMEKLVKNYEKALGIESISLDYLGSKLSGDYKKNQEVFKIQAIQEQINVLEYANANGLTKMNLYAPYPYAFKYVDNAKDIPYETTKYEILDNSIPFYQLVVSGLFDYSGQSINANSEKGIQEHIMRIIETGSNIAFTFSYDNSSELLNTDYNTYFYTTYTEWLEDVEEVYNTIEATGISRCQLTKHEIVGENVYRVTYTNNVETIQIVLNYSRVSVNVDGWVIPAKSFRVVG